MRPKWFSWTALAIGLGLTSLQIGIAVAVAPGSSVSQSYSHLCKWDCGWYQNIAANGYRSAVPPVPQKRDSSNVAFFPGYPYLGRAVHLATGLSTSTSLLLIAQLGAVLFWAALWTLLRRWRIPPALSVLVLAATLAHPAAFYLVAGYSESLFIASLLLVILASPRAIRRPGWLAAFWGTVMSATRIVGVPAAAFPTVHRVSRDLASRRLPTLRGLSPALVTSLLASLGGLAFFVYCGLRFGRYDLHMESQRIGWGLVPDYGALFKWSTFRYAFPLDHIATLGSGIAFAGIARLELLAWKKGRPHGFSRRLPVYATAFLIYFVSLSGLESVKFRSMIRYSLPWFILLLLCLSHLSLRAPSLPKPIARVLFVLAILGLAALFYSVELPHLRDYLKGRWFA